MGNLITSIGLSIDHSQDTQFCQCKGSLWCFFLTVTATHSISLFLFSPYTISFIFGDFSTDLIFCHTNSDLPHPHHLLAKRRLGFASLPTELIKVYKVLWEHSVCSCCQDRITGGNDEEQEQVKTRMAEWLQGGPPQLLHLIKLQCTLFWSTVTLMQELACFHRWHGHQVHSTPKPYTGTPDSTCLKGARLPLDLQQSHRWRGCWSLVC